MRFVESQFDKEQTADAIHSLFPSATDISVTPMPLREIFVALAKARRKAA